MSAPVSLTAGIENAETMLDGDGATEHQLDVQTASDRGGGAADHGMGALGIFHARLRQALAPSAQEDRLSTPLRSQAACFFSSVLDTMSRLLDNLQKQGNELPCFQAFHGKPLASALPVLSVCTIMGTLYVSFVWVYMPAVGLGTFSLHSVAFHTVFYCSVCSYHAGVITDPGAIPDDWRGDPEERPQFMLEDSSSAVPSERKKTTGMLRYCSKEKKFKPDRAHYCRALNRNVLRMDHFCPWLNNCIGYYNHKYFVLFLFYTVVDTNFTTIELYRALMTGGFSGGFTFMMYQGVFMSGLLAALLTPFFSFHCWLLARNMTTVEYCEKRSSGGFQSPHDVGVLSNIESVMGDAWPLWLLPVGPPPSNGLFYARRDALGSTGEHGCRCGDGSAAAAAAARESRPAGSTGSAAPAQEAQAPTRGARELVSGVWEAVSELRCDVTRSMLSGSSSLRSWCSGWGDAVADAAGIAETGAGQAAPADASEALERNAVVARQVAHEAWARNGADMHADLTAALASHNLITQGASGIGIDDVTPDSASAGPELAPRIATTIQARR